MTNGRAITLIGRYPITIVITIMMHAVWSIGLMFDQEAINATGLHTVLLLARHPAVAAFLFGAVAISAAGGLVIKQRYLRVFLILPQQLILWFSIVGAGYAMFLGQFADGIQRAHWFLIVDQIPVVLIALGHTAALLLIAENGHGS